MRYKGRMRYVQCPEIDGGDGGPSLFLGGGITGCPDWQASVVAMLSDVDVTLVNPKRRDFTVQDPAESEAQIRWEHRHLRSATAILFWFPCETLCPITLYELGAWSMSSKPLFVGVHPEYKRRVDVQIQTRLVRPDVSVVGSLDELTEQVRRWITRDRPAK